MTSILGIETATDTCSVAVLQNDIILIESSLGKPRAHAEHLVPMIRDVLSYANLGPEALDGIAVSMGPGSYTGLRIGVSAAKGLAFAHQTELMGVPSLLALAFEALPHAGKDTLIGVASNARKHEIYFGLYQTDTHLSVKEVTGVAALQHEDIAAHVLQWPAEHLLIVGEGGRFVAEAVSPSWSGGLDLLASNIVCPSASSIAKLGAIRYQQRQIEDLSSFEPYYLKEFIPKKRKQSIFDRLPF